METLKEFFRVYNVPHGMALRVRQNVEHIWIMQQGLDVDALLSDLPENLRVDVLMELQSNIVQNSYLFKKCDKAFIKAVMLRLKPQAYLSNEAIISSGEAASEIYFIRSGKVKVTGANRETVFAILKEGDIFGDLEIFSGRRRTENVDVRVEPLASSRGATR
ncbi:unnamed protein product [Ostreobium quekettii]|uniref:Cyclic nucleotide-binding domain-containing protein n=1 Tax=Ostreobium quekettii TaxID=121088 RepID=A0A8S1IU53_9CHLO|nr:unnamed protein product [Ostreobium quekettii]